jgi:hypothetical protein
MDKSGQFRVPADLHRGKNPQYLLDGRLGDGDPRASLYAVEEGVLPLPETEPRFHGFPGRVLVPVPNEQSKLLHQS